MKVSATALPGVLLLEPAVFSDARGFLLESWNAQTFAQASGLNQSFVQDNHSHSLRNVLRGIHYQVVRPQGKLVRVVQGAVWDVAVDLRRSSPHFGRWVGTELSAANHRQLWIPPGFGHAFVALSPSADLLYKMTEPWIPAHDRAIAWNDPQLGIAWPIEGEPLVSEKDRRAPPLSQAELFD